MGIKDMAKIKRIEILLDKYWQGETTVAEEQELKGYFNGKEVAEHLRYIAPLFQVLKSEEGKQLPKVFERQVKDKIEGRSHQPVPLWSRFIRYAAAIVIAFGVSWWMYDNYSSQDQQPLATVEDTFDDPQKAYAQLKSSLQLVSKKLNSGNEYIEELDHLNTGASLFNQQKEGKNEK